jgi:hypothetical protein
MCEELLEAEGALSSVDKEAPDLREARRTEWQDYIDRSLAELQEELRKYSGDLASSPRRRDGQP